VGGSIISHSTANSGAIGEGPAAATTPTLKPFHTDSASGIGGNNAGDYISVILGGEEFIRVDDAGDVASAETLRFIAPTRAVPADDDEAYLSFFNEDSGSTSEEFSRISWIARDVTTTEEDGALQFDVDSGGTLTQFLLLDGLGTGDGQVVMPTGSIGTGEILDDTVTTTDLNDSTDTPSEGQLVAVGQTTTEVRYVKPPPVTKTLFDSTGIAATDDVPDIHIWAEAVEVTDVRCISTGGTSLTLTLEDDAGNDLVTSCVCTTSLVDCTLAAGVTFTALERLDWTTVSISGVPTSVTAFIEYKYDL
jgi:hypothetical protein